MRSALSNLASALPQLGLTVTVSRFFVNTQDGRVATRAQLAEAELATEDEPPELPWHRIQGPSDASTMWYAVLRKRERGVFIGTLVLRHSSHHALLASSGWEEIAPSAIGVKDDAGVASPPGRRGAATP